ncbi:MAG: KH domain-containing protein [bacterium]
MTKIEIDREFLEFVVKSIVSNPDDVKVVRTVDEMGVLLSLRVNPEDMGQIIGREGSTARAVRTILRVIGVRNNARINLKIEEPDGGSRARAPRNQETPVSSEREVKKGVDEVVDELKL